VVQEAVADGIGDGGLADYVVQDPKSIEERLPRHLNELPSKLFQK